jgi:hypothetical protein
MKLKTKNLGVSTKRERTEFKKKFGIPIEHAQRVDRIINKKEYEKELFLRA